MRIWDFPVHLLCSAHLSAEHRELHGIWGCIHKNSKNGYINHPEVKRWIGNLPALHNRHQQQLSDFIRRKSDHIHNSFIELEYDSIPNIGVVDSLRSQYCHIATLRNDHNHKCTCDLVGLDEYIKSLGSSYSL